MTNPITSDKLQPVSTARQKFHNELVRIAKRIGGEIGYEMSPYEQCVVVRTRCRHGRVRDVLASLALVDSTDPTDVARAILSPFVLECQRGHKPKASLMSPTMQGLIGLFGPPAKVSQGLLGDGAVKPGQFIPPVWLLGSYQVGHHPVVNALAEIIPGLTKGAVPCPDDHCRDSGHEWTVYRIIVHLNDHHHWKREAIADWLDTLDIDLTIHRKEVA